MIAGKVMMDRNAPAALRDDPQRGYDESKALIARWAGRGRLDYAITPRFAVTSSEAQLEAAGALAREHPQAYVQTHLTRIRRDRLRQAPVSRAKTYLDVYDALWAAWAALAVRPLHPSRGSGSRRDG